VLNTSHWFTEGMDRKPIIHMRQSTGKFHFMLVRCLPLSCLKIAFSQQLLDGIYHRVAGGVQLGSQQTSRREAYA
jgi:hypothetical protein